MKRTLTCVLVFIAIAATACGSNGSATSSTAPTSAPAMHPASKIPVAESEWQVAPQTTTGKAGKITFKIHNAGKDTHEFVVVKTDLDAGKLPTKANGSVDESKLQKVDEAEDISAGKSATLKVDLKPGTYALFCNIVEHNEIHYKMGMRSTFTVS